MRCGDYLRTTRRDAGLTQVELAAKLDVPQSFVSKIETGERCLRVSEVFDYAEALGLTAENLVQQLGSWLDKASRGE